MDGPRQLEVALAVLVVGAALLTGVAWLALADGDATDAGEASGGLSVRWISETESGIRGNHHAVAAARVDGEAVVLVPLGGRAGDDHAHPEGGPTHTHAGEGGCALVALDGGGGERWRDAVGAGNCTIHAVADPALADFLGDDRPEALYSSTDDAVTARDPLSGEPLFEAPLRDYGYTRPVVADVTGDGAAELVALDVTGSVFVYRSDGSTAWTRRFGAYTWAQPAVADFDADGDPEVVAAFADGHVRLFEGDSGRLVWNATAGDSITWTTTGQADDDPALEVVAAAVDGSVVAVDGRTGEIEWRRDLGDLAAVRAFGDADGDGVSEVYATARDGVLRALDARTGEVEWETTLTTGDTQMTPPPSLGDVDGDGSPEVVAVTNDGIVRVVDPASGEVVATHERDVAVYTHLTAADTDGDGRDELYVPYGDGRVVALEFE